MNFVYWHSVGGVEGGCKDGVYIICHIISMYMHVYNLSHYFHGIPPWVDEIGESGYLLACIAGAML